MHSDRVVGKCQNWKVSELESVGIGKCQNQKVSELESVRLGKHIFMKMSYFRIDSLNTESSMQSTVIKNLIFQAKKKME